MWNAQISDCTATKGHNDTVTITCVVSVPVGIFLATGNKPKNIPVGSPQLFECLVSVFRIQIQKYPDSFDALCKVDVSWAHGSAGARCCPTPAYKSNFECYSSSSSS